MRISPEGIEFIKQREGLRLTAYQCSAGVYTIGYGSTKGVPPGQRITEKQAESLLQADLKQFEAAVNNEVAVPLSQLQFDACVSIAFNIGVNAFTKSTLLRLLNQGKHHDAAAQFLRWNKVRGKPVKGLTERRKAEQAMFLKGTDREPLKPLRKSRELAGSTTAALATIAGETVTELKDQVEPLALYADSLRWVFLALAMAGIILTIYARYDNRRKGYV
jgi:lysozyme